MINNFREIVNEHRHLVERQDEISPSEIMEFIKHVGAAGEGIVALSERDQLRAILRYWSNVHYEKSEDGIFPNIDLATAGPETTAEKILGGARRNRISIAGTFVVLAFLGLIYYAFLVPEEPVPVSPTRESAVLPTIVFTETVEIIQDTPTPVGISVSITNPEEGESVLPKLSVRGNYQNLQANWTIHVLVQLLKEDGFIFPGDSYFVVPEGQSEGQWSVSLSLSPFVADDMPVQVNIFAVVAVDEQTRTELIEGLSTPMREIPQGALTFNQVITAQKGAYIHLSGPRFFFSFTQSGQKDIGTTDLIGNDLTALTSTNEIGEIYPSISPDGRYFLYIEVDKRVSPSIKRLVLTNIKSGSREILLESENIVRYPSWSPDSMKIAFNIVEEADYSGLYIYSLEENINLEDNPRWLRLHTSYVSPAWLSNSELLVSKLIYLGTSDHKTWALVAIDENSLQERVVRDTEYQEELPKISPTNRDQIAYYLRFPELGRQDIHLYDISTGVDRPLIEDFGLSELAWAPDGRFIYYNLVIGGSPTSWRIDVVSGESIPILEDNYLPSFLFAGDIDMFQAVGKIFLESPGPK